MSKNILLMMMGGSGVRFGADIPKQFVEMEGKPIFSYIVSGYAQLDEIDAIVIVCHADWIDYTREWVERENITVDTRVVAGGASRSESVRNGLFAAAEFAETDDVVLIHDATHPYVDEENLAAIIEATKEYGGATLGQCQYDTVYCINAETKLLERVIPREQVVSGASPEAFMFGRIYDIYSNSTLEELERCTSAGALALANGMDMKVIPTNLINLKITYKNDLDVFGKLFRGYYF